MCLSVTGDNLLLVEQEPGKRGRCRLRGKCRNSWVSWPEGVQKYDKCLCKHGTLPVREPGWNPISFKLFPPFFTALEGLQGFAVSLRGGCWYRHLALFRVCKHNLQTCCLGSKFRCLDTSGMWYVPNPQEGEGSSDDQVGEVNTHCFIFQCYLEQRSEKCDPLSQHTFLPGNIFARLGAKARSEGM